MHSCFVRLINVLDNWNSSVGFLKKDDTKTATSVIVKTATSVIVSIFFEAVPASGPLEVVGSMMGRSVRTRAALGEHFYIQ